MLQMATTLNEENVDELISLTQQLQCEDPVLELTIDNAQSRKVQDHILVGKLISDKRFSLNVIKTVLQKSWRIRSEFQSSLAIDKPLPTGFQNKRGDGSLYWVQLRDTQCQFREIFTRFSYLAPYLRAAAFNVLQSWKRDAKSMGDKEEFLMRALNVGLQEGNQTHCNVTSSQGPYQMALTEEPEPAPAKSTQDQIHSNGPSSSQLNPSTKVGSQTQWQTGQSKVEANCADVDIQPKEIQLQSRIPFDDLIFIATELFQSSPKRMRRPLGTWILPQLRILNFKLSGEVGRNELEIKMQDHQGSSSKKFLREHVRRLRLGQSLVKGIWLERNEAEVRKRST
ncbi:hypothetical protein GH714_035690 [Hevea brasiliensis]|uniref:Uncharacterized protein n=1 Tax=Hevea brasiliensis TaxID=3981 RepID=A0A6A6NEF9_HEVBR|nr:hypothetical protein GH714_035690 [Hevea brasiliensis]